MFLFILLAGNTFDLVDMTLKFQSEKVSFIVYFQETICFSQQRICFRRKNNLTGKKKKIALSFFSCCLLNVYSGFFSPKNL